MARKTAAPAAPALADLPEGQGPRALETAARASLARVADRLRRSALYQRHGVLTREGREALVEWRVAFQHLFTGHLNPQWVGFAAEEKRAAERFDVTVDNVLDGLKVAHDRKLAALGGPREALAEITTTADAARAMQAELRVLLDRFQSSAATLAAIVGGPTGHELHDHARRARLEGTVPSVAEVERIASLVVSVEPVEPAEQVA